MIFCHLGKIQLTFGYWPMCQIPSEATWMISTQMCVLKVLKSTHFEGHVKFRNTPIIKGFFFMAHIHI